LFAVIDERARAGLAGLLRSVTGTSYADDELVDAAETASLLCAKHHQVRLDQEEFEKSLPNIVRFFGGASGQFIDRAMYFRVPAGAAGCEGGIDRAGPERRLAGYTRHLGAFGRELAGTAQRVQSLAGTIINQLPRNEALKRGVQSLGIPGRLERYEECFRAAPGGDSQRTVPRPGRAAADAGGVHAAAGIPDGQTGRAGRISNWWKSVRRAADELLMYADKLSMAHSLEAGCRTWTRTVVEYAQRLDSRFKVRRGQRKWLAPGGGAGNSWPRQILKPEENAGSP